MATTFDVIFLGTIADLDPTEGNSVAENAGTIVGTTFGSVGDPLSDHLQTFAPGSTGYWNSGSAYAYDVDNASTDDRFTIDGGADQTMDAVLVYDATITYDDLTTATITAVVFQDSAGNLYLAPETIYNADQIALEAKPIQSLTLDSVNSDATTLSADRYDADFDPAETIDGTSGDDVMGVGYTDGDGDQIDGADGDKDIVDGGAGNDTIDAGAHNDVVYGGDGADNIDGGAGDDTLYAGDSAAPEAPPNAVGYWTFDSYSWPEDDLAAPDNDMTFEGGANVPTASGQLELDGSGDYGVISDNPAYDLDDATITMSFTLDTLGSQTGLFGMDAAGNALGDFSVYVDPDGQVIVLWQDGSTNYQINSSVGAVGTGVEHTVHVSFDNTSGSIELYVDGALEGSVAAPGVTLTGNTNPMVVGGLQWTSTTGTADIVSNTIDGSINSFAIYDGVYTPAELAAPGGDADTIDGGDGNDDIHGDSGDDILIGGADADTFFLYDVFGDDTITGGETGLDNDKIDLSGVSMPLTVVFTGAESGTITDGTSTVTFSEIEVIETGSADDVIDATGAGTAGVSVYSGFGDDTVTGSAGDDSIGTSHGNDTVFAGAGDDTISTDYGDDTVWTGDGNDWVSGSFGDDTLYGEAGDDYLYGGYGVDEIHGGDGDDRIGVGRNDGDIAYGDSGSDTFFFDHDMGNNTVWGGEAGSDVDIIEFGLLSLAPVNITWTSDEAGTATDPYGTTTFYEIEGAIGSDLDDVIDASISTSDKILSGGAGADIIAGGAGDDTISGGTGDDGILGNGGDDTFILEDSFGDDTIVGGETGEANGDTIDASLVTVPLTVVYSSTEAGTISDGTSTASFSEVENLILGSGDDVVNALSNTTDLTIEGGAGDDTLTGGYGTNTLDGGDDADTFNIGYHTDIITGGEGGTDFDTISIAGADDAIDITFSGDEAGTYLDDDGDTGSFTEVEAFVLSSGADTLDGTLSGADITVDAGDGADTITGGSGDDIITGGTGDDTLTGGGGDDTFTYSAGDGADTISDFNTGNSGTLSDGDSTNNDFIDLSAFYDDIWELHADQADDGILNQSNDGVDGVDYSDNTQFQPGDSLTFTGASADGSSFTVENTGVICFAEGTRILTPEGEVKVEKLKRGDRVITQDNGAQKIRWIGSSKVARSPALQPIRIARGTLGDGIPNRTLYVSPQHRLLIRSKIVERMTGTPEVLVAAKKLTDMRGIRADTKPGHIRYFHILCDTHEIVTANGAPAETLLPGPQAQEMMGPEAWEELTTILPGIGERLADVMPARPVIRAKQKDNLTRRHRRNGAALVEPLA